MNSVDSEDQSTRIVKKVINDIDSPSILTRSTTTQSTELHYTQPPKTFVSGEITRKRSREPSTITVPPRWIQIEAQSDKLHIYVRVDGKMVYEINSDDERRRGLHIIVLNQETGKLMAGVAFDFYGGSTDSEIAAFLDNVKEGRIFIFLIKDEGTHGLKKIGRNAIKSFGSRMIFNLAYRDHWACISKKMSGWVVEDVSKRTTKEWPPAVKVHVSFLADASRENCDFGKNAAAIRRRKFCSLYEGYPGVCECKQINEVYTQKKNTVFSELLDIPVVIIASSRPRYLFRMLRKLMSVPGANPSQTTVYIDGEHNETAAVAELFGLKAVRNEIECTKNCRIQQHYKKSLTHSFDAFPLARAVIILEEDLEVSIDIFDYFSPTWPLLEADPSLYCVSAWNDQGYKHSVKDPALLYRVETMPGLGWLLKRSLFKNELEPKWPGPNDYWDWDMWMRTDYMRKGRECIVPDKSRTYHFGAIGLNVRMNFQKMYFSTRVLNDKSGVKFDVEKVKKENYEKELERLIRDAVVINYTKTTCKNEHDFIPNTTDATYVLYIKMTKEERYDNWLRVATCFRLWDLDMRDFHFGLIRFWIKNNHVIVIGAPESNYAHHKPKNIKPVEILKKKAAK
eukprot:gene4726-21025_t